MTVIFSFLRLQIGGIAITLFFLPGVFCLLLLSKQLRKTKTLMGFIVIIFLILTATSYSINEENGLFERYVDQRSYIISSANWFVENSQANCIVLSDSLTSGVFMLKDSTQNHDYNYIYGKYATLTSDDILYLVWGVGYNNQNYDKYIICNYALSKITIDNWVDLQSWDLHRHDINNNMLNKIYTNNYLDIFHIP